MNPYIWNNSLLLSAKLTMPLDLDPSVILTHVINLSYMHELINDNSGVAVIATVQTILI